ncbi:hypothetical protein IWX90DRAFT_424767, partial [Phyllosticta citrichinensis]
MTGDRMDGWTDGGDGVELDECKEWGAGGGVRYFKPSRQSRQSLGGVRVPLVQQHPRPERPAQCPPAADQDPHTHPCFQGFGLDIRPLLNRHRRLPANGRFVFVGCIAWPLSISVAINTSSILGVPRSRRREWQAAFSKRRRGTCRMRSLTVDHGGRPSVRPMSIAQCSSQNSPASHPLQERQSPSSASLRLFPDAYWVRVSPRHTTITTTTADAGQMQETAPAPRMPWSGVASCSLHAGRWPGESGSSRSWCVAFGGRRRRPAASSMVDHRRPSSVNTMERPRTGRIVGKPDSQAHSTSRLGQASFLESQTKHCDVGLACQAQGLITNPRPITAASPRRWG